MVAEMNRSFHGEKVAFGLLVQFVMEEREKAFLEEMVSFLRELGLPTTLRELGLSVVTDDSLHRIAKRACLPNTYMHNMPMRVDEALVIKSVLKADALGQSLSGMR
jgi:glycerol dehydrogenase